MIVNFTIENWMSFKESTKFSMLATRERQNNDRLPKIAKYSAKILPIAAIFGGNASGKTNFFKALNFMRWLVLKGTQPDSLIPLEPFRLDDECLKKPSRFNIELLIDEIIYELSFAVTQECISEEKLVRITSTSEKILYHRHGDKIKFDKTLKKEKFLHFAFQGTRKNQLFLTNSVSQKIETFRPVYNWFRYNLELVAPDSRFEFFEQFFEEEHPLFNTMNEILQKLDTGISHLGGEEVPFENLPMPDALKKKLQEDVTDDVSIKLLSEPNNERYIVSRKNGKLVVKKLVAFHTKSDGSEVKFDLSQESDGSQRIIDLLPVLLAVASSGSKKVILVDEMDRSLHSTLTKRLLEAYLDICSNDTRSQLMVTTHDILQMDQELFRRDEMWVTERNSDGVSTLFSFSEYKDIRYDKDIRKSYQQGRLGGVPRLSLDCLTNIPGNQ